MLSAEARGITQVAVAIEPAVEGTGREPVVIVQGHSMNWCDDGVMKNEITPSLRKIGLLSDHLRERLVAIGAIVADA